MTAQHMGMVYDAEGLDGPEKLLLGAYCNRTDDHGYCWPGQDRLADDCGTSVATVKRVKQRLIKKGLIKSVRRVNPRTGDPISNLTRVNVPLLASMKRPPREYQDNMLEAITFEEPGSEPEPAPEPESGPDLLRAQDEPNPPSDLLRAQDEPDPGLKMNPTPAQDEPQTLSEPSAEPSPSFRPYQPDPPRAREGEKTDGRTDDTAPPQKKPATPGTELLLALGREYPLYLLSGRMLADQSRKVDGLLETWTPQQVYDCLTSRALPAKGELQKSPGAVISARLDALMQATPVGQQVAPGPPAGHPEPPPRPEIPPACSDHLGEDLPMRTRESDDGSAYKCPDCHPYAARRTPSPAPF